MFYIAIAVISLVGAAYAMWLLEQSGWINP
jgi:hypothetical protein